LPVLRGSHGEGILSLSGRDTAEFSDWRVMDLAFDGERSAASKGVRAHGGASRITLLRLEMRDVGSGVQFSSAYLDYWNAQGARPAHAMWDQIAVADTTIRDLHDGAGAYISARRLAFLGNVVERFASGSGHLTRFPFVAKGVIAGNVLSGPTTGLQAIKLHAPCLGGEGCPGRSAVEGGGATEQVVIAGNELQGAERSWTVTLGPQSHRYDERLRDILVERNWFRAGPGTQVALVVNASEVTVRNNICDMTGANDGACFDVFQRGPHTPPPEHVRIYNNTGYTGTAQASFAMVRLTTANATASQVTVANNLAWAPHASSRYLVRERGTAGLVQAANLLAEAAPFAVPQPLLPQQFSPAGSLRRGAAAPVRSDFFGAPRAGNVNLVLGAVEGR
jgi:hypothetical protein